MMSRLHHVALPLALLIGGVTVAAAQTLNLNEGQRLVAYRTLIKEAIASPPPAGANIMVGNDLPAAVAVYPMPVYVVDAVPTAGNYTFTVWNNQIVLVDRNSRKVMAVIRE
jgi:uncharacterized protein DUF1236